MGECNSYLSMAVNEATTSSDTDVQPMGRCILNQAPSCEASSVGCELRVNEGHVSERHPVRFL